MASSATRDTGTKRTGSASVKIVSDTTLECTYVQSVNVGDTNTYTLVAYAYTSGAAVTTTDLDLWYNGAEVTTTFTADSPAGWYKLSGTLTGANASRDYGVRVHANKTVYVDDLTLTGPAPATTVYLLNSGTSGVAALDVESSVTASNFVSDVAVGTQPYATTSTTVNTNLNADLLDGAHVGTSGATIPLLNAANTWSAAQTISDVNLILGTTTGTKIGTATSQKLGFFNATPIIQPTATTEIGTVLSNLGLRAAGTAYPITTSGTVTLASLNAIAFDDDAVFHDGDMIFL